jgi:metal-responsive CopG/Arc/MetJ family transcriptional regulator
VNFECKEEFLKAFDAAIDGNYDNRSEAIRDSMRRRMRELQGAKA